MKDLLAFKLFEISGTTITVAGICMGITFLVLGLWFSKRVHFLIRNKVAPRFNIDQSTGYAISSLAYYLCTSFTTLFAISIIGFDLSSLALVAGALSVGVGLGLQTIANNFVSGLLLLFDRSMKVGACFFVTFIKPYWSRALKFPSLNEIYTLKPFLPA